MMTQGNQEVVTGNAQHQRTSSTNAADAPLAAHGPRQPEADTGHDYAMPTPNAETGAQFCLGVMGPATLSVAASQIAVEKATDADTRRFANFELREALAVVEILKSLETPAQPMNAAGQTLLVSLAATPAGADFDKVYITAQLANHEFLRDLAESYLQNTAGPVRSAEMHGRNLAALALTAFKEHVVLAKNIVHAMEA